MNVKDILNADVQTVGWWLRRGFIWWIDQLLAMLPADWRARFGRRTSTVVEFGDDLALHRQGEAQAFDPATLSPREKRNVTIALPLRKVLTRTLDYPMLPLNDIRRMIALDIDRLTPFRADAVFYDTEIIHRDPQSERQQILLGVLPRVTVTEALARAAANDLVPSALGAVGNAGSNVHFNFLPAARNALGSGSSYVPYWWAAVAVLVAVNLGLLAFRDSNDLDTLRQNVESQRATVSVALRLREKVEAEAARRAALLARQAHNSPLRILDAVTKALPANAWAQHFEWNGQTVRIAGYRNGPADLLGPLEASSVVHNVHTLDTEPQSAKETTIKPFNIAADLKEGAAR
jgi:general secretion pathway protein L